MKTDSCFLTFLKSIFLLKITSDEVSKMTFLTTFFSEAYKPMKVSLSGHPTHSEAIHRQSTKSVNI